MKNKILILVLLPFCFITPASRAQGAASALAAADTLHFSSDKAGGWLLYNSFMSQETGDSVRLELILQQDNAIDWSEEHFIGTIKTVDLRPQGERTVSFVLNFVTYRVRINGSGNCYLKLESGLPPNTNPVIIPFAVVYKK